VVTVTEIVALLLPESATVTVQDPAASAVTLTLVPDTLAVATPLHPEAEYGPAVPSVIVTVCVALVAAPNDKVLDESESGISVGVGIGVGEASGLKFTEPHPAIAAALPRTAS
jgi:hypothetical protein